MTKGAEQRGTATYLDGAVVELLRPNLGNTDLKAVKLWLISGVRAICKKRVKGYLRSDTTALSKFTACI